MKACLMCGLGKLKRKKVPNFLLGICILITAALLVNAVILLKELNAIFDRAYAEMDGPHLCCLWNNEIFSPETVRQFLDGQAETLTYQITEHTKTIDYMEKDGVRLSNGILLELPETAARNPDMLSPLFPDGSAPQMPAKNEIWVTPKLAAILNLKAGDTLILQMADRSVQVKASKIVTDPVFGGSSTNIYRMWCGHGQLSDLPPARNNAASYLEVRFAAYTRQTEQDFIRSAEEYFDMPLGNTLYTYDRIKGGYTAPWQMIGSVCCLVSIVLSVTIVLLTLFLIQSDIDEDVRNIGIYKTLGMTGAQIIGSCLVSYGIIAFAGAALGCFLGGKLNRSILAKILGDIGLPAASLPGTGGYQFLIWILVPIAVLAVCLCPAIRIRRLNASLAIRTGAWHPKKHATKRAKNTFYNGKSSFELYYAVRGMQNKKQQYLYIAGVSMILGCLAVSFLGCLNAVKNIDQDPELWGFIQTDIYVTSSADTPVSAIITELEQDPRIRYTYGANKISSQYRPAGQKNWQNIVTELYELPWKEEIRDRSLYGRRPVRENEIGVGLAFADQYGLQVGDSLELTVNGRKNSYEITGIFQTLSNYGNVIRMVTDDLDRFVAADGKSGDYMLVLTGNTDKWDYAEELTAKYAGKFSFIASKSNGENISGILAPAFGTVLTILIVVTVLIVVNLTLLLIRREQHLIGLLKAAGMTSWQILKIYLCRNCLSALVGNSIGMLFGILIVPGLLAPRARLLGLTEFPFVNSLQGTAVSFVLLPLCMLLGTCTMIRAIHTVSVRHLVSE